MNSDTSELLRLIDRELPQKPSKKNILESPAIIGASIKSMFYAYKKSKEF